MHSCLCRPHLVAWLSCCCLLTVIARRTQDNRNWSNLSAHQSVKDLDARLMAFSEGSGVTTTDFSDASMFGDQPVKFVHKDVWTLGKSFWEDKELANDVAYEEQFIRFASAVLCLVFVCNGHYSSSVTITDHEA